MSPTSYRDGDVRSNRRFISHVSRACDRCRKRKMKCDGIQPVCGTCAKRGWDCAFEEEDGRKTNNAVDNLRTRVAMLESMIANAKIPGVDLASPSPVPNASPPLASALAGSSNFGPSSIMGSPLQEVERKRVHSESVPPTGDFEHQKRPRRSSVVLPGSTSTWIHAQRKIRVTETLIAPISVSPETEAHLPDWRRSLPPALVIDRQTHDNALQLFAAYYAPWCMTADMPTFLHDMAAADVTQGYSPLLHCTIVFVGMCLLDDAVNAEELWNDSFHDHCTRLLLTECANPSLASLRGLNLLAACLSFQVEVGYMFFGMAIAAMGTLGLNINTESYVQKGQMTIEERNVRDDAFWTIYTQDTLRAIAFGRPPLLPVSNDMSIPTIETGIDREPWSLPPCKSSSSTAASLSGLPSMRSTVLHWTARLCLIFHCILDTLYSVKGDDYSGAASAPATIVRRLVTWNKSVPIKDPTACPLPHILVLHMTYQVVVIYLHRPFYLNCPSDAVGGTSVERCNKAAATILDLLDLYDDLHGLAFGPVSLRQVIFSAATVFLLNAASQRSKGEDPHNSLQEFEECVRLMTQHKSNWDGTESAFKVLNSLRQKWLNSPATSNGSVADTAHGVTELEEFLLGDMDWFLSRDLLDFLAGMLP